METKLDAKIILEKEFKTGMRGYNQEEVDLFFDDVIQDYQMLKKRIAELEAENNRIKEELERPKSDLQLEILVQRILIYLNESPILRDMYLGASCTIKNN